MINNVNNDAMAIIFPNIYDDLVPELVKDRLAASIPFASRYRLIDFTLSSLVNSGIDDVSILPRENYHSLQDHLGTGREWDLARKNGGVTIFPPFAQKTIGMFTGRVDALHGFLNVIKSHKEKYVIMTDCFSASNFDFKAFLSAHIASGADVTAAYTKQELPESVKACDNYSRCFYYTFDVFGNKISAVNINSKESGIQNFDMNIYAMDREWLIDAVEQAYIDGGTIFERDILRKRQNEINILGYEYKGYVARIYSLKDYFDESMKLLNEDNLDELFDGGQIYTKVRDDNPTRYIGAAKVGNVMLADGSIIEGEVENCVFFKGVKVGKGAVVKNCILMQDTVVEPGAKLEYVISDKDVTFTANKELKGNEDYPVYVAKFTVV